MGDGKVFRMEHVERLQGMVRERLSLPHSFYCHTKSNKKGWWAKLDLFRPGLFKGTVLYFDLDVTLEGSIDKLVSDAEFMTIREFLHQDGEPLRINASAITWQANGPAQALYSRFSIGNGPVKVHETDDQALMLRVLGDKITTYPRDWCVSHRYEAEGRTTQQSPETCVRVYHGKTKPWPQKQNEQQPQPNV